MTFPVIRDASGFYRVRLTAAAAPAFRLGAHLPEAALQSLVEARDRAAEISADVLATPWDRSVLGFASPALRRIGLAP